MKYNDKETEVNEEDATDPPTIDVNINDNSDNEKNDYEVTPDTPTNGGDNEMVENDKDEKYEKEAEKYKDDKNLNMKANDKKTE